MIQVLTGHRVVLVLCCLVVGIALVAYAHWSSESNLDSNANSGGLRSYLGAATPHEKGEVLGSEGVQSMWRRDADGAIELPQVTIPELTGITHDAVPAPLVGAEGDGPEQPADIPPSTGNNGGPAFTVPAWDSITWDEPTCEDILNRETDQPLWLVYYKCIYTEMMVTKTRPLKVMGYRKGDGTGFGNRMRGTITALNTALVMGRVFFLNHDFFFEHFDAPDGVSLQPDGVTAGKFKLRVLQDPREREIVTAGDMVASWDSHDTMEHYQGNAFDREMFENPRYEAMLKPLFGTTSRFYRTGMLTRWLCSNPKQRYIDAIDAVKTQIKWNDFDQHVVVQLRTMADAKNKHKEYLALSADLWQCYGNWMEKVALGNSIEVSKRIILFATDASGERANADRVLGPYGMVTNNGMGDVHTSALKAGDEVSSSMIDWWLMGEAEYVLHSGTTFGIFAAARTNYLLGRQHTNIVAWLRDSWTCDSPGVVHMPDDGQPPGSDVLFL